MPSLTQLKRYRPLIEDCGLVGSPVYQFILDRTNNQFEKFEDCNYSQSEIILRDLEKEATIQKELYEMCILQSRLDYKKSIGLRASTDEGMRKDLDEYKPLYEKYKDCRKPKIKVEHQKGYEEFLDLKSKLDEMRNYGFRVSSHEEMRDLFNRYKTLHSFFYNYNHDQVFGYPDKKIANLF